MFLMQGLWLHIDDIVGKGLDWDIIAKLLFYMSMGVIPIALPLSILLATIMTFGSLGEKNELFAMKSGGISLYRIMFPLFIFNIFITIGAFYYANNLLPYLNLKRTAMLYNINEQNPEINIISGIFTEPVEDFYIKADKRKSGPYTLENIIIYDHRNTSGNRNVTTAKYGNIKMTEDKRCLILDLHNGYRYEEVTNSSNSAASNDTRPHQRTQFYKQTVYIEIDVLGLDQNNEDLFKGNYAMIDNNQIVASVDSIKKSDISQKYDTWRNITTLSLYRGIPKAVFDKDSTTQTIEHVFAPVENIKSISLSSLYDSLTPIQKTKVIETASNYARSAKSHISISQEYSESKKRLIARHEIEWHNKYTLSVACMLFFLIGAPLGAIIRKGGIGFPVIISAIIYLFYHIISTTFKKTVSELVFSAEFGMWVSTMILVPIIVYFIFKAGTDSMRVSSHFHEIVKNFFKRIYKRTAKSR
jgi:lipopolysaccharide export system permease protein